MVTAEDKDMLSTNNNDYDYIGRERHVIELYKQGKSTISLRICYIILIIGTTLLISDIIISALWSRPFADIIIRKHYKWRVN
ncbi:MAG: hypothetical protein WCF03_05720 [Nitrososphaeraceae archaeon]